MEHKLSQLKALKTLSLSQEERGIIRAHAVRTVTSAPVGSVASSIFNHGIQQGLRIAVSAMALVMFVGGSVSAIANKALPGDSLYSFKLNVNEEVKGLFLKTPEERVLLQENLVENRIGEIKTLAESQSLTQAKQEIAQKAIDGHVEQLSKDLDTLSDQSPNTALTVTASLQASLQANKAALSTSATNTATSNITTPATARSIANSAGTQDAIKTVNGTLQKVSQQEVKILSKEIDSISQELDATPDASTTDSASTTTTTPTLAPVKTVDTSDIKGLKTSSTTSTPATTPLKP